MSNPEFEKFAEELFKDCLAELQAKGVDYSSENDSFLTAKRIAEMNDISTRKALGVFLSKHIVTILRGVSTTEPMRKRIVDAINFLVLIEKWDNEHTER